MLVAFCRSAPVWGGTMEGVPWDTFAALLGKGAPVDGEGAFDAAKLVARSVMAPTGTGWSGSLLEATCRLPMTFFPAGPTHQSVFSDKVRAPPIDTLHSVKNGKQSEQSHHTVAGNRRTGPRQPW